MKQESPIQADHDNLKGRGAIFSEKKGEKTDLTPRYAIYPQTQDTPAQDESRRPAVAIHHNALEITAPAEGKAASRRTLRVALPNLPSDIPEEDGTSLQALSTVLLAYHRVVPEPLRDEYIRQLMKFAGEQAGAMLRMSIAHASME